MALYQKTQTLIPANINEFTVLFVRVTTLSRKCWTMTFPDIGIVVSKVTIPDRHCCIQGDHT